MEIGGGEQIARPAETGQQGRPVCSHVGEGGKPGVGKGEGAGGERSLVIRILDPALDGEPICRCVSTLREHTVKFVFFASAPAASPKYGRPAIKRIFVKIDSTYFPI
jgi:hypothetical protein